MFKFGGYTGKVLRVDLTTSNIDSEPLNKGYAKKFLGGRGLAVKLLFDELSAKITPLSSQNKLVFMTGPLTGSAVPGTSRFIITTKSPQTNIYTYTVAGGGFGPTLKRSGYDAVIVEGESCEPKYLFIEDGKASLKDASWLWGTPVFESTTLIKEAVGSNVSIAAIGPGGERLAKMAAVITDDRRAAARGGPGAVMGSKKLKAIVVRGKQTLNIADHTKFSKVLKKIHGKLKMQPGPWKEFPETGTQSGPRQNSVWGILPTRNWQEAVFEGAEKISYPHLREKFLVKDTGCIGCPVRCTKITLVKDGPYAGALTYGPDYETLYAFGSACGVDVPEAIIAADMLCDNFGLDTISTGLTIAWAMECFERGILDLEDTDGLELRFGNHEAMVEAVRKIAYKDGKLGQLLAMGSRAASKKIGKGTERYSMQVKGLELGGYDPRGSKGMAIVFGCGPRGGCHHAYGLSVFIEIPKGIALQSKGKGQMIYKAAIRRIISDSSPICTFYASPVPLPLLSALISSVTGINITVEYVKELASRVMCVERAFNAREGLDKKDDVLPNRLLTEPLSSGPNKGQVISHEEFQLMKKEFYRAAKWDLATGLPTRNTLDSLGLGDVAVQLYD